MSALKDNYEQLTGVSLNNKKKKKKKKKSGNNNQQTCGSPIAADPFGSLEVRVGKIVKVWEHPDVEKLFCEEIDLGNGQTRTVASGLRHFYTLEQMSDRKVLVVCNLQKRKMGKNKFPSMGMVLCAQTEVDGEEKVELIDPPADSVLGDRVTAAGVESVQPTSASQTKKRKILEKVLPHLSTNADRHVTYKG